MPVITRTLLESRRAALQAEREQHLANANAAQGAILLCEQLLAALDAPDAPPLPEPAP